MALADRIRRYAPATLRHATAAVLRETLPSAALRAQGGAVSQCRSVAASEALDAADLAAVLLRDTWWGEVWLVADDDVLADHPDIASAGLPVVRFAELPHLQRLDAEGLRALGLLKRTFPTARVLQ